MKKKIIIFGMGDFARLAHLYFNVDPAYEVTAFTVNQTYIQQDSFQSLPLVPFETVEKIYEPDKHQMFIAIGYSKLNKVRADFYQQAKNKGYQLATYISPHATVLTDQIGDNTFIFEDNTIQPFVSIGNNVILWSGNHIGHDSIIEDHCFISSHVVLAGWTIVGKYCFIGVNATIRDKVKIGEGCIIGAGSLITKQAPPGSLYTTKSAELAKIPAEKLRGI